VKMGWFGVIRGHSGISVMYLFDTAHTIFYSLFTQK